MSQSFSAPAAHLDYEFVFAGTDLYQKKTGKHMNLSWVLETPDVSYFAYKGCCCDQPYSFDLQQFLAMGDLLQQFQH